jgi:hypothetical protein
VTEVSTESARIAALDARGLHRAANRHNWDEGTPALERILAHPACSLGTALLIYWLGGPWWQARWTSPRGSDAPETWALLRRIEQGIEAGRFGHHGVAYDPRKESLLADPYPEHGKRRMLPDAVYCATTTTGTLRCDRPPPTPHPGPALPKPRPRGVSVRALNRAQRKEIELACELGAELLGRARTEDPEALVGAIASRVTKLAASTQPHDARQRAAVGLGGLLGEQLARGKAWSWCWLAIGDFEHFAVAAPEGRHAAFPFARVNELLGGVAGSPRPLFELAVDDRLPESGVAQYTVVK